MKLSEAVKDSMEHVFTFNLDNQAEGIEAYAGVLTDLIEKGKLSACQNLPSSIARSSLLLGQIDYVIHNDLEGALCNFAVPISSELEPNFNALARLINEGMCELRQWDGGKISFDSETERIICYLLLNRVEEMRSEYALVGQRSIFVSSEERNPRAVFNRHMLYAVQDQYDEIRVEDYARAPVQKSVFFHGVHLALIALAKDDEAAFVEEISDYSMRFLKRKNSKQIATAWGYGLASAYCFDVVGTILYRLAVRKGLGFPTPTARWYPRAFWDE